MKESKAPSLGRTPAQKFFDKWQGLFYLIPWIIGFVVFKAIPFGQSLYYSFTDMDFFNGIHQYGIMNYVDAFSTPKITKALITTFKYSFIRPQMPNSVPNTRCALSTTALTSWSNAPNTMPAIVIPAQNTNE